MKSGKITLKGKENNIGWGAHFPLPMIYWKSNTLEVVGLGFSDFSKQPSVKKISESSLVCPIGIHEKKKHDRLEDRQANSS